MYLLSIPCLIFIVASVSSAAVHKCHFENLNDCGTPLSDFRKEHGQKFPTTEAQVSELCQELDKSNGCMTRFQDSCMTPMQLQMMGLVTEGSYDVYKEFCRGGSDIRSDYLKHAECMNAAHESDEYKGFASYVEAGMEDFEQKPKTDLLPTACCGYHYMDVNTKKLGTEKCGADAVVAFQRVATMAASNLPDMFCSGFDPESSQCTSLMPPPGTQPKGTLRESHIAKSFAALYL